jgi:hypothetical protein
VVQAGSAGTDRQGDLEARRIAIEERRLELEERQAAAEAESGTRRRRQEDRQTRITAATVAISIFVPLMVAAVAYWSTAANEAAQSKRDSALAAAQSRRDFELEAARIVLSAESPAAASHKANLLKALFPDKLSPGFATEFKPAAFETYSTARSKREVLNLMLAHPGREAQIVAWWARLFPADAEGKYSFLPAFAQGALTQEERTRLLNMIHRQVGR